MGYYVETIEVNFTIPSSNLDDAYKAMCELNQHNELKSGGRHPSEDKDGPHDGVWFSWMHWNYDEVYETAKEILEALGFELYEDENGDLSISYYNSKIGNENHFLNAIAPYVADSSYIEWRGEDGSMWRSFFTDGKMVEQTAVITWE